MDTKILAPNQNLISVADLSQALADFLRLNVADGDASPKTSISHLTWATPVGRFAQIRRFGPGFVNPG